MEKKSFAYMLTIRYIVYFAVVGSIIALNEVNKRNITSLVVFLLLYIINTQVRIYFLWDKTILVIVSLLIEIIIISFLYYNFGGFTFVYYFVAVVDTALMLTKNIANIMTLVLYGAVIFQSMKPLYSNLQEYPIANIIFNTVILIGFGGLGRYIAEERARKTEAHQLYDKISMSEQELKEAYYRLEQYSNTVEELSVLKERDRISRELHDTAGHTLSTLIIQIQALPFIVKSDEKRALEMLSEMYQYTKDGLEDVRRAVRELSPVGFDRDNGIFVLLELTGNFERNTGIKVEFKVSSKDNKLTSDQSLAFYRIIQEALSNSLRHGRADNVKINLHYTEREICLNIKDDGIGKDKVKADFGLKSMEDRVRKLGGRIEFFCEEGMGFEININIPQKVGIV